MSKTEVIDQIIERMDICEGVMDYQGLTAYKIALKLIMAMR